MAKRSKAKGKKTSISRRGFIKLAGGAAGTAIIGCKTLDPGASLLDAGPALGTIVRAAIHPGIGVARLGNSTADDGFVVGPEVTTPPPAQASQLRDGSGALKRQAARFRIYGYDANNNVVAELTPDNATIQWSVHLANRKAAHYSFNTALDIAETSTLSTPRRNPSVTGDARNGLVIDPGVKSINGKNTAGPSYHLDGGSFMGTQVSLGEVRTDTAGRLLVLGGHGVSASPTGTPIYSPSDPSSFNNAAGWYDDTADGPVTATVTVNGQNLPVDGAWVIVTPPNFAPDVIGWRTLYDLLVETYVAAGTMPTPQTTSFTKDILPILQRMSGLQWVNAGFAAAFGKGGASYNFDDPSLLAKLAQAPTSGQSDANADLRNSILMAFRTTNNATFPAKPWPSGGWPWIYGDAYGSYKDSVRDDLLVSDVRTQHLQRWVEGNFAADWNPQASPVTSLDQVALADQPATLDEAALTFCLADAFHPGCEVTWPMRHASMYSAPFRVKTAAATAALDVGDTLSADSMSSLLDAQGPGDLTKWMALPWQGDTAMCRSGYDANPQAADYNKDYDPYLSTFWPARVPNQVLAASDYATVMNTSLPLDQRLAAYKTRVSWYHGLPYQGTDPVATMVSMVGNFGSMGIVVANPGIPNDPNFPPTILVESLPAGPALGLTDEAARANARSSDPMVRAGWKDAAHLAAFRKVRGLDRGHR